MGRVSWLWQDVRALFEADDGSLPEIRIAYRNTPATAIGYEQLVTSAAGVVSHAYFWSKVREEEVPLDAVPNAAALVVSGEAEPFHVVLNAITSNDVMIPKVGVFVFPSELVLDYRMGAEWRESEVVALFELLSKLKAHDSHASILLKHRATRRIDARFARAWERWCHEHGA